MKVTETVIALMFELSNLDDVDHTEYLSGHGEVLRRNLLRLFNDSMNPLTHDLIVNIMIEAGYPWFKKLAGGRNKPLASDIGCEHKTMNDDEFMDLLPANGRIH